MSTSEQEDQYIQEALQQERQYQDSVNDLINQGEQAEKKATYTGMKIGRASKEDIDLAIKLISILDAVEDRYYHEDFPQPEWNNGDGDREVEYFDADDPEHLQIFYKAVMDCVKKSPAGLLRVVWGFGAIMDPENKIVDMNKSYLDLHPRILKALEAQEEKESACQKPT